MLHTPTSAGGLAQISLSKPELLRCLEKMFFRVPGNLREHCSGGGSFLVQVYESHSSLLSCHCFCTLGFSAALG